MPTVLQVLPALETGGVERSTVDVAQALVAAGWLYLIHIQVEEIARQLEIASAHTAQPTNDKEFDVPVPFQRG